MAGAAGLLAVLPQLSMAQDAPVFNNGDVTWLLVATAFVLLI
jgi:hypothetical protein